MPNNKKWGTENAMQKKPTLDQEHYCENVKQYPVQKFLQPGIGKGKKVLVLGEAPAPNGWRKSGKAFYNPNGKILASGKNLNKLLSPYGLSIETCAFTELIKCYVGSERKKLKECGKKCWPIFIKQLEAGDYKLVIILGAKTLEIFNSLSGSTLRIGEISTISIDNKKYKVLPIYHPSPINPNNHPNNIKIFRKVDQELNKIITN